MRVRHIEVTTQFINAPTCYMGNIICVWSTTRMVTT